jgi:glutathione S-transferase
MLIVRNHSFSLLIDDSLFLKDAGAAYKDVRYSFEEWPEVKHSEKVAQANPTTNLPFIEIGGKYLTQTYAILRHWARQLGGYDGKTENEKYFVDQITDIVIDCV